jgi:hypothetical protein
MVKACGPLTVLFDLGLLRGALLFAIEERLVLARVDQLILPRDLVINLGDLGSGIGITK